MVMPVVLTRAQGQNEALASQLREQGLDVLITPLLEIDDKPPDEPGKQFVINLDLYDHIIFVSQNAVKFGMPLLEQYWPQWPVALAWHAVGAATGEALANHDIEVSVPDQASSEGLLAQGRLDEVLGQRVLIVRGVGGREALAQALETRGARVDYLEVYERRPVRLPQAELAKIVVKLPVIVVIYSGETLQALAQNLLDVRKRLFILVPSGRVGDMAAEMGFEQVTVVQGASVSAMMDGIKVIRDTL